MPVPITSSAVRALSDVAKPYRARQVPAGSSEPARLLRAEFDGSPGRSEAPRGRSRYRVTPWFPRGPRKAASGSSGSFRRGVSKTAAQPNA
jgi:hypothetical protein